MKEGGGFLILFEALDLEVDCLTRKSHPTSSALSKLLPWWSMPRNTGSIPCEFFNRSTFPNQCFRTLEEFRLRSESNSMDTRKVYSAKSGTMRKDDDDEKWWWDEDGDWRIKQAGNQSKEEKVVAPSQSATARSEGMVGEEWTGMNEWEKLKRKRFRSFRYLHFPSFALPLSSLLHAPFFLDGLVLSDSGNLYQLSLSPPINSAVSQFFTKSIIFDFFSFFVLVFLFV